MSGLNNVSIALLLSGFAALGVYLMADKDDKVTLPVVNNKDDKDYLNKIDLILKQNRIDQLNRNNYPYKFDQPNRNNYPYRFDQPNRFDRNRFDQLNRNNYPYQLNELPHVGNRIPTNFNDLGLQQQPPIPNNPPAGDRGNELNDIKALLDKKQQTGGRRTRHKKTKY